MTPRLDDIRDDDRYLDALGDRRGGDDDLARMFEPWLSYVDEELPPVERSTAGRYARGRATMPHVRRVMVGAGFVTATFAVSSVAAAVSGTTVPVLRQLGNVTRALSGEAPMPASGPVTRASSMTVTTDDPTDPTGSIDPTSTPDDPTVTPSHSSSLVIGKPAPTTSASRSHSPLTRTPVVTSRPTHRPTSSSVPSTTGAPTSPSTTSSTTSPTSTGAPTTGTGSTTPKPTAPTTLPTLPTTTAPSTTAPSTTTWGPRTTQASPTTTGQRSRPTSTSATPTATTSTSTSTSAEGPTFSSSTTSGASDTVATTISGVTGITGPAQRVLPEPIGTPTQP